jgi:hypothetical protein
MQPAFLCVPDLEFSYPDSGADLIRARGELNISPL